MNVDKLRRINKLSRFMHNYINKLTKDAINVL